MTGWVDGATLRPDQEPWPLGWERDPRIDDEHPHQWERITLLADGKRRRFEDEVVRCTVCHAPRCGHSGDEDPCMERRHHRDVHITLSGRFEPLGGYLRDDRGGA